MKRAVVIIATVLAFAGGSWFDGHGGAHAAAPSAQVGDGENCNAAHAGWYLYSGGRIIAICGRDVRDGYWRWFPL